MKNKIQEYQEQLKVITDRLDEIDQGLLSPNQAKEARMRLTLSYEAIVRASKEYTEAKKAIDDDIAIRTEQEELWAMYDQILDQLASE